MSPPPAGSGTVLLQLHANLRMTSKLTTSFTLRGRERKSLECQYQHDALDRARAWGDFWIIIGYF